MSEFKFGNVSNTSGDVMQGENVHKGDVVHGDKIVASDASTIVLHADGAATVETAEAPEKLGPIFVSHAHADAEIVRSLLELLASGVAVKEGDILATSLLDKGIPPGKQWADYLKDRLTDTRLVVMVLTPNFLKSDFCLIELGGLWVLEKPVLPIVVPPLEVNDLGHILADMQCLDARLDDHLQRARAEVAKVLGDGDVPDIDLTESTARFRATLDVAGETAPSI